MVFDGCDLSQLSSLPTYPGSGEDMRCCIYALNLLYRKGNLLSLSAIHDVKSQCTDRCDSIIKSCSLFFSIPGNTFRRPLYTHLLP